MTAFAHIGHTDLLRRFISIYIGFQPEAGQGPMTVLQDGGRVRQAVNDGEQCEPTLRLDEAEARALLTALLNHYQGGDDTRQLRKDYEAERLRVDKFIAHLTGGNG